MLLHGALYSAQTSVRSPELLLKSYARPSVHDFEVGISYPLIHSDDKGYYVHIRDKHDVVLFLDNEDLTLPARVRDGKTVEFWEPYTLETDRAYLAFMPDQWYRVISETETAYRIEYVFGETKMHCAVGKEVFESAQHILNAEGALIDRKIEDPKDAICVIQFQNGVSGSGFLLYDNDTLYCYTNQHVAMNVGRVSIQLIDGRELELGGLEISEDSDLARIRVMTELPALDAVGTADLQQKVRVLGNSLGAGRVTILKGTITGLNAKEVETSAKFVSGNSGSPILNEANEVVGVATLLELFPDHDTIVKGSEFEDGRRVGMRLDREIEWVSVERSQYASRNRLILQTVDFIEELPVAMVSVFSGSLTEKMVLQNTKDPVIKQWLRGFVSSLRSMQESFDRRVQAIVRVKGNRFLSSAAFSRMELEFRKEVTAESLNYWTSLKRKVIAKRRSLSRATPYPDTTYMHERIAYYEAMLEAAETVIDAILEAHNAP